MSRAAPRSQPWTGWSRRARYGLIAALLLVTFGAVWLLAGDGTDGSTKHVARSREPAVEGGGMTGMEIQQFGVTFGAVEQRVLEQTVRTVGIVSVDETRLAQVSAKVAGFVERLYVDFTGQPVRRGQPLLELYSPELVAAQEELLLAGQLQRAMGADDVPGVPTQSTDLVASAKRRLRLWDISEEQIETILQSGEVRRTLTLHSPLSGIVLEKHVQEGQAIREGATLYAIADLSEVWVEAELREADIGLVREGSWARIEVTAYPGRTVEGRVEYVYPTLQREARTLKARVAVPNLRGMLKPGMYATVRLATPTRKALTAPTSAVVRTGERTLVFVDLGKGRLLPQEIEVGRAAGAYTEILAGLEPGQRVVTSAQFLLDSESNLAEVMKSMMGQMGTGDMGNMDGMNMQGADMKHSPMRPREGR